jgi:hypothetical protein
MTTLSWSNDHADKCVDVPDWSKTVSTPLHEWDCRGGDNQLWWPIPFADGSFPLMNRNSGMCMDIGANGTGYDGVPVVQAVCDYVWRDTRELWRWQAADGLGVRTIRGLCAGGVDRGEPGHAGRAGGYGAGGGRRARARVSG